MRIEVFQDRATLARSAAAQAAGALNRAIAATGGARLIAATGSSQLALLDALIEEGGVDWTRVELFHLDEYIGLPATHPASFRRYLRERLIDRTGIFRYHLLDGDADPMEVIGRVGHEISAAPIDLALAGIGENGHLAFNDPPADFDARAPFLIVQLDAACRRQQVGEGWFHDIADVPAQAISMSIHQILQAREIVCIAPEARKARAVALCFAGEIGPHAPASILRTHPHATVYLDRDSAQLLG